MSTATTPNVNQVNTSILGMSSAVFTSLCTALVTTAVKSNVLIDKTFNVAIHGVSAAEHIADAGEKRAKIYSDAIVKNGSLAERESEIRARLRLLALERQEAATAEATKAAKPKPAIRRTAKKAATKKAASKK